MCLRSLALAVLLFTPLAGCSGGSPDPVEPAPSAATPVTVVPAADGLRLVKVVSGLKDPLYVAQVPGSEDLYVVEQAGLVVRVDNGRRSTFLDIRSQVLSGGEQGLLSIAFHPRYRVNHRFYIDYTNLDGDTRVVEYRFGVTGPRRLRLLLAVDQPYSNHNGGQLQFGPDGRLYVGMGDGGSGGDPAGNAQNLNSRLGKLLSLDVDRPGSKWRVAAYGLRNPWRFSFDKKTGDLWLADVGQDNWEEVDFRPRRLLGRLANYGWDVYEGTHPFEQKDINHAGGLVWPLAEYAHAQGCSVTGGYLYRGYVKAAQGRYFYGDYCSGAVWSLRRVAGKVHVRREPFKVPALSSFGEGVDGNLYLVSHNGTVWRLTSV